MSPMCFASTSHTFELITVPFTIMLSKLAPDTMVFNNKMMCIRPSADFNELTAYYNLHREQTDTSTSPTNQSKTSQSATNVKILIFILPTFQWDSGQRYPSQRDQTGVQVGDDGGFYT